MTVKEVKEALSKIPDDAIVVVYGRIKSMVATDLHQVDNNVIAIKSDFDDPEMAIIYI